MIEEWENFFEFVKQRDKELDKHLRDINDYNQLSKNNDLDNT